MEAIYLFGCDGASSSVRHALNLNFSGSTYEHKFFVADVKLNYIQTQRKIMAFPSRNNFCAFFPMPGLNNYRLLGTLPTSFRNNDHIAFDDVLPIIKSVVKIPFDINKVNWFSTYNLRHRIADRFNVGACFLLGDAAHVHSPAGGQGMNTGLQDAHNLSWKIAMVINGSANKKILETYTTERQPFAKWLLKFTDRLFTFMTSSSLISNAIRKYLMPFILPRVLSIRVIRSKIFLVLAQLWYTYDHSIIAVNLSRQKLKFDAGSRCPYVKIDAGGSCQSTFDLLTAPSFYLLSVGGVDINKNDVLKLNKLNVTFIHLQLTLEWIALGVTNELYMLIRPDQYIGMLSDNYAIKQIQDYFARLKK